MPNEFEKMLEETASVINDFQLKVEKGLEEERKTNTELLQAKADGKAVAELEEKLAKQEKATTEAIDALKKQYDDEIAGIKMNATSTSAATNEDEIKQAFFDVVRLGNDRGVPEEKRALLADVMYKQFSFSGEPKSMDQVKSMLAGIDSTGGSLLMPPTLDRKLMKYVEDNTDLYRLASHTNIGSGAYSQHGITEDVGCTWIGEAEEHRETKGMRFGDVNIPVQQIMASPAISRILIEDAMLDVEAEVMQSAQRSFARSISDASVNGDGVKRLRGILNYPVMRMTSAQPTWGNLGVVLSGAAGGFKPTSGTDNPADIFMDLQGVLANVYQQNAGWLVNRTTATFLRKLKDKDGAYIWETNSKLGTPATFLGAPVYYDYNMPDIAAGSIPVLYGDFGQAYKFVHRRGLQVSRDITSRKGFVVINIDMRLGGGVTDFNAVKGLKIAAA